MRRIDLYAKRMWRDLSIVSLILAGLLLPCLAEDEPRTPPGGDAFTKQVAQIAEILSYKDAAPRIEQVDWNGKPSLSAILTRTTWRLKSLPQSVTLSSQMERDAMKLPEAKRLEVMDRLDDHVQLWAVAEPFNASRADKTGLIGSGLAHQWHRELFYLGQGQGLFWYGYLPIYEFAQIEHKLSLQGDELLPALIRGMGVEDQGGMTSNSCAGWLTQIGDEAIGAVDQTIADRLPKRARLVGAVGQCRTEATTRWLIRLTASSDVEVSRTARHTLLWSPRAEAADLYLRWFAEGAGRRDVRAELSACRTLKLKAAAESLPAVLAAPADVYEYRLALEVSRELTGNPPLPASVLTAEKQIHEFGYGSGTRFNQQDVDRAVEAILAAGDPPAEAAVGMSLAVYTTKGDTRAIHKAGVEILRRVPGGEGKRLARLLARTNQASWQADEIKTVAAELERP